MCSGESQSSGDDDTLMDCLIRHKNVEAMRPFKKCRAVIEDFQVSDEYQSELVSCYIVYVKLVLPVLYY